MENLGEDHASSDSSLPPSAASEEYAMPDVILTYRLRDRELLKKRKAEALEKDSAQWILRENKIKKQRRARKTARGRGRQTAVKAVQESEPAVDPQPDPDPQEKAEPVPSEPALPEPVYQQQSPAITLRGTVCGMPAVAVDRELPSRSLDPAGEENVLKLAGPEELEELNTSLESDHQDNQFNAHVLY